MLASLRKNLKIWSKIALWPVILAFIGTIFLVWGRGNPGTVSANAVAKVNESEISIEEYRVTYDNLTRLYQQIYGDRFHESVDRTDLERQALRNLIDNRLIWFGATEIGLEVNDDEVAAKITTNPVFHLNGQFSAKQYDFVLQRNHMDRKGFEMGVAQDILVNKVQNLIFSTALIYDDELRDQFTRQNLKATAKVLHFTKDLFQDQEIPYESPELKEYYEEHKEDFRTKPQYKYRYLHFDPKNYVDTIEILDEEVEDYYDLHYEEFHTEEQVRASHILIRSAKEDPEEKQVEARRRAEEVLSKAKAGEDFSQLVKAYSEDTGSVARGGDLGFFGRGQMVPEFEDQAFSMEPGEISDLVQTNFGFHIIKATERKADETQPLEQARNEIISKIRLTRSDSYAFDMADRTYEDFFQVGSVDELVEQDKLKIHETKYFDFDRTPAEIGFSKELKEFLDQTPKEELSSPIKTFNGYFLLSFQNEKEAYIPEFEAVEADVKQALLNEKRDRLAKTKASETLVRLRDGMSIADAAIENKLEILETKEFTKTSIYIPKLGRTEHFAVEAFKLNVGEFGPVTPTLQGYAIFQLTSKTAFDEDVFQKEKESLRKTLIQNKQRAAFDSWLEKQRSIADINYSPSYNYLQAEEETNSVSS